jgi:hypothetical protein
MIWAMNFVGGFMCGMGVTIFIVKWLLGRLEDRGDLKWIRR